MSLRATGESLQMPIMPPSTEITSYRTYAETQAAIDFLSDGGFDIKSITIVGADLHLVGRVASQLTTVKAAPSGAFSGAL